MAYNPTNTADIVGQSDIGTMLWANSSASATTNFEELVEIKDTPDTGSDPEQIEITTLKKNRKIYTEGRQDSPSQAFTYNYTEYNFFTKVNPFCDGTEHAFLVVYPDGTGTLIVGKASNRVNAISLNSAIEATLTITPTSIEAKTSAQVTAMLAE